MNPRTARSTAALSLLAIAPGSGCEAKNSNDTAARPAAVTTTTASSSPDATDAPPDTEAPTTTAAATSGNVPSAWPAGVPLPSAVDPAGAAIPGSLATDDDPPAGEVVLFTFTQGQSTALQSAFTGVGVWAEDAFDDFPNGTPCAKDDASRAALSGGSWSCDGLLPDGRLVQIATRLTDGRLSLDVVVKRP